MTVMVVARENGGGGVPAVVRVERIQAGLGLNRQEILRRIEMVVSDEEFHALVLRRQNPRNVTKERQKAAVESICNPFVMRLDPRWAPRRITRTQRQNAVLMIAGNTGKGGQAKEQCPAPRWCPAQHQ